MEGKRRLQKYIQWLHDNDYAPLADIVRHMYNLSADNYEVVDVYRYSVK